MAQVQELRRTGSEDEAEQCWKSDSKERIHAQVAEWLDGLYEGTDECAIGTFAVIFEVLYPKEDNVFASSNIGWTCPDPRNWVQAGLFRRAHVLAEAAGAQTSIEDEDE